MTKKYSNIIHRDEIVIKQQQKIAKLLFDVFESMGIHAVLAGGAPRNWHFGFPASDLDFYIELTEIDLKRFEFLFLHSVHEVDVRQNTEAGAMQLGEFSILWVKGLSKKAIPKHLSLFDILEQKDDIKVKHNQMLETIEKKYPKLFSSPLWKLELGDLIKKAVDVDDFAINYESHIEQTSLIAAYNFIVDGTECQIMISTKQSKDTREKIKNVLEKFDCSLCCTAVTKQNGEYIQTTFEEFHQGILEKSLNVLDFINISSRNACHVVKMKHKPMFNQYAITKTSQNSWELDHSVEYPI